MLLDRTLMRVHAELVACFEFACSSLTAHADVVRLNCSSRADVKNITGNCQAGSLTIFVRNSQRVNVARNMTDPSDVETDTVDADVSTISEANTGRLFLAGIWYTALAAVDSNE